MSLRSPAKVKPLFAPIQERMSHSHRLHPAGGCGTPASEADVRRVPQDERPTRILIVEDEVLNALYLQDVLEACGYEVCHIAPSAQRAVSAATMHEPDLILMDIRLAGGSDGIEAAITIYKQLGIRSVFVTAQSDPETKARAQAACPLGFLAKPVSARELERMMRRALDQLRDK